MTIASIHQPQYLPWLPYCAKADGCQVFVYLDNVQYQKNGVQNRNQIKTAQGAQWLTVPVNASSDTTIRETRIADQRWTKKHLQSIRQNYARAPFLDLFEEGLRPILEQPHEDLAGLNIAVTEWLFRSLGIGCKRIRASELKVAGMKDDLVIAICKAAGATVYLSGHGAKCYQDEKKFRAEGIELRYHEYHNPTYAQCHPAGGFLPDLSSLDLILNAGPDSRAVMLSGVELG
jgi:hypothetical protein